MKQSIFQIIENSPLTDSVYRMRLTGDTSPITAPGQFVNIQLDGFYLRRPISVCDCEDGTLTLIYKVVGKGTEAMRRLSEGSIDILTGLGNGYDTSLSGDAPLLLGGGVGVPPLYLAAGCCGQRASRYRSSSASTPKRRSSTRRNSLPSAAM